VSAAPRNYTGGRHRDVGLGLIGIAIGLVVAFGAVLMLPAAVLMAVPAQVEITPRRV